MAKAILLTVDGKRTEIEPANGSNFKLKELYGYLDCDMIQVVDAGEKDGERMIMIVDEEGKIKGNPLERFNPVATDIARPYLFAGDIIVGNAIYCPSDMLR